MKTLILTAIASLALAGGAFAQSIWRSPRTAAAMA